MDHSFQEGMLLRYSVIESYIYYWCMEKNLVNISKYVGFNEVINDLEALNYNASQLCIELF